MGGDGNGLASCISASTSGFNGLNLRGCSVVVVGFVTVPWVGFGNFAVISVRACSSPSYTIG